MQTKQIKKALVWQSFVKSLGIGGAKEGKLPSLIVIGAQKCGTTSLHYYLSLHPQISMSRQKELNFFIAERNWEKGIEWYKSNFVGKAQVYGESSPNYTAYPMWKGIPGRMYSSVPEAKLIYIVRDPVDRVISGYLHSYLRGLETRKIEVVLTDLDTNIVFRSRYFMQIEQYLKYYPKSNILVIALEDLQSYPRETLKKVFKFLNVDESYYSKNFEVIRHKTDNVGNNHFNTLLRHLSETYIPKTHSGPQILRSLFSRIQPSKIERPMLDEKLRSRLIAYLRDDINRLREFTGNDFEGWCV